ncbi:RecA-superfamily ATPase implicated in signal transduction [Halapricum desulfuricans]|uniref:non-specific serine/threonine protein kinase n=1 Tax=Halapricum desulfuricans TaxID=2841257 RepID=A0A897NRA4_9EURY|nr:ATPase domain-containing protein [Halapricum desulfuricans]QSG13363.1 RecA-superfamily ATPase implicated in signal transduction [Halapricum desulfuricans]
MTTTSRLSTGIDGLDTILDGGLIGRQNVIVRGPPGAGKTIFGLHFLAAGTDEEDSLYINLGEPTEYVQRTADHFGLNSETLQFLELSPDEKKFTEEGTYTLFSSAEAEQPSLVSEVRETVEELQPDRVLIDPITEFRFLTTDDHQFRSQILGLLDFLRSTGATVLMTSQAAADLSDTDLQFLTDAVINLEQTSEVRTVDITKFRGPAAQRGPHAYEITESGVDVWPRLEVPDAQVDFPEENISSGVPELDQLLDGGLDRGTVTFFSGPTGAGKTTTSLQFVQEAAGRGSQSIIFSFEESRRTLLQRAEALNMPIGEMIEQGVLDIVEVQPREYTVNQLTNKVQDAVEADGVEVVLIDGTQGFKQNLRGHGENPITNLIEIGRYLRQMGVTTIVTNEVHDITGQFRATEEQMSNLADNIVFIRHVESRGKLEKVIGVLKMRTSDFERTLRKLEFTEYGVSVGDPLENLQGVLTGTPEWADSESTGETDG